MNRNIRCKSGIIPTSRQEVPRLGLWAPAQIHDFLHESINLRRSRRSVSGIQRSCTIL